MGARRGTQEGTSGSGRACRGRCVRCRCRRLTGGIVDRHADQGRELCRTRRLAHLLAPLLSVPTASLPRSPPAQPSRTDQRLRVPPPPPPLPLAQLHQPVPLEPLRVETRSSPTFSRVCSRRARRAVVPHRLPLLQQAVGSARVRAGRVRLHRRRERRRERRVRQRRGTPLLPRRRRSSDHSRRGVRVCDSGQAADLSRAPRETGPSDVEPLAAGCSPFCDVTSVKLHSVSWRVAVALEHPSSSLARLRLLRTSTHPCTRLFAFVLTRASPLAQSAVTRSFLAFSIRLSESSSELHGTQRRYSILEFRRCACKTSAPRSR